MCAILGFCRYLRTCPRLPQQRAQSRNNSACRTSPFIGFSVDPLATHKSRLELLAEFLPSQKSPCQTVTCPQCVRVPSLRSTRFAGGDRLVARQPREKVVTPREPADMVSTRTTWWQGEPFHLVHHFHSRVHKPPYASASSGVHYPRLVYLPVSICLRQIISASPARTAPSFP